MKVVKRFLGLSAAVGAGAVVGAITAHQHNRSLDPRITNARHK